MRKVISFAVNRIVSIALGMVLIFPLIYAFLGAFRSAEEFAQYPPHLLPESFANLENFRRILTDVPMPRYMFNSLLTGLLTGVVKVSLAAMAAYAFTFYDFRGRKALFWLILASMMLPADTLTITNYRTVSRLGLTDSYLGICVTSFVGASQVLLLRQQFKSLPRELKDAALIDGCGDGAFLVIVVLPMSRGILLTLFLQSFIAQWNSYLWPLLVTSRDSMRTVQVGISMLTDAEATNYETVLAGACVALVPSLILFFLSRAKITGTVTAGAVVE